MLCLQLVSGSMAALCLFREQPPAEGMITGTDSPKLALAHLKDAELNALFVFCDLGEHLKDALISRLLRDVQSAFSDRQSTMFLIDDTALEVGLGRKQVLSAFGRDDAAQRWHDSGARLIGGCCRTTPAHIAAIAAWARPPQGAA